LKKVRFFNVTELVDLAGLGSVGDWGLVVAIPRTEHEGNCGTITRGYPTEIDSAIGFGSRREPSDKSIVACPRDCNTDTGSSDGNFE
jgi:hypothetical protein